MKLFISLMLSLFSLPVFSQIVVNNNLNKFIGTWRWSSGMDTVEITLEKQVYHLPMTGSSTESLVGWHRYVKNGVLQQSSFNYIGRDINVDTNSNNIDYKTTLLGNTLYNNPNKVYFTRFWDLTLHKSFQMWFTLLPNSTTQATWKLFEQRGGIYAGPEGLNAVYTLPKEIILTKQ